MIHNIIEIYEYRDMIWSLVRRELRGKYEKSVLGFLWAFLGPLFQILIYAIVFTSVFYNDMPHYYIYLMAGMLPWTFFNDSMSTGTGSIIYNSEMVKKIYFPREVLVIGEVNAKLVNMLLSFIVMAAFLIISGVGFSVQLVLLPVVILGEYLFTLGMSLFVAAVTVYFRDLEYVIQVVLMAWIWASPIMYSANNVVNPLFRLVLTVNPFTYIARGYQSILYYHVWPGMVNLVVPLIYGVIALVVGYVTFVMLKRRFAEEM